MRPKPKVDTARELASKQLNQQIYAAMLELSTDVLRSSLDGTIIRTRKFAHIDPAFELYLEIRSRIR